MSMTILLTGAAGFIGAHVCRALLGRGHAVLGLDNLNPYYDPGLKRARLDWLQGLGDFRFAEADIAHMDQLQEATASDRFDHVIHLAAQAGVRYSLENPAAYGEANLLGHLNILELCRSHEEVRHLVYASSSSVYGDRQDAPFRESDPVGKPVSLYAATKLADEMLSYSYSHLYQIPQTGLRFFTVYGPWGRPDMAYWSFTEKIFAGEVIPVYNHGNMRRDFTYIDDIVAGILEVMEKPVAARGEVQEQRILNIGNNRSENLLDFIACLEQAIGRKANMDLREMQPGDVRETCADISAVQALTGFSPKTSLAEGIPKFIDWYRRYYGL